MALLIPGTRLLSRLAIFGAMTTPQTLTIRSFTDRAEALAHFVLRAGEAPGFWRSTMPLAVRWTSPWRRSNGRRWWESSRTTTPCTRPGSPTRLPAAVIERKGRTGANSCTLALDSTRAADGRIRRRGPLRRTGGKGRRVQPASPRAGSFSSGQRRASVPCWRCSDVARRKSATSGAGWVLSLPSSTSRAPSLRAGSPPARLAVCSPRVMPRPTFVTSKSEWNRDR